MRYAIAVATVLLLASCAGSGGASGREIDPPTQADYARLAKHVLENTPEHVHFAKGAEFSWCFFIPPQDQTVPELTEAVLDRLRKRYTVYLSGPDIPADRKVFQNGRVVGFRGGFQFNFEVERLGPRRVRIHYADWEGLLAGSRHSALYEWTGKSWKVVQKSPLVVS